MLNINPEIVCNIIDRARQFQAKEQVVMPETVGSPNNADPMQTLADHPGDLTHDEALLLIRDLEPDQQVTLLALMWLGRGDFTLEEWPNALREARDNWTPRIAEYLMSTPLLPDYLATGLNAHGYDLAENAAP